MFPNRQSQLFCCWPQAWQPARSNPISCNSKSTHQPHPHRQRSNEITVDPDVATLHIGFQTQPSDAKAAYAAGAQTSNAIIGALKQAGVQESAIHSESQRLDAVYGKPHKFTLAQQWTVKVTPSVSPKFLMSP